MALVFTTSYVEDAKAIFHQYKRLAEGAIAQVADEQLTASARSGDELHCPNRETHDREYALALDGFSDQ